ncbi:flavodoxin family protein [Bacteroidota bacterium]
MKKAAIYYLSKTGITRQFGEEIKSFLELQNISGELVNVLDYNNEDLNGVEYVFLGAWTHGLMIILQHPDKPWIEFAKQLPDLKDKKVTLFTTYKLATGSMFKKMKKHLKGKAGDELLELKSKNDQLSDLHKEHLRKFINQN